MISAGLPGLCDKSPESGNLFGAEPDLPGVFAYTIIRKVPKLRRPSQTAPTHQIDRAGFSDPAESGQSPLFFLGPSTILSSGTSAGMTGVFMADFAPAFGKGGSLRGKPSILTGFKFNKFGLGPPESSLPKKP
jgi:hypothetical protein